MIFPGYIDASGNEVADPDARAASGPNANAVEFEEIDINQATGRAKYIINPADNLAPTPTP